MVRETVADITKAPFLDVLFDGIESLLLGDLHLRVGPARNLDNHVKDTIVLVGKERDVVERRHDMAVLLDVDAMFCRDDQET